MTAIGIVTVGNLSPTKTKECSGAKAKDQAGLRGQALREHSRHKLAGNQDA
jgi:hypothetical protein